MRTYTNTIKNAAGLGYMQGKLKELIAKSVRNSDINLTIDGFYGPETLKAFKVFFRNAIRNDFYHGEHDEGIMVFQKCYNEFIRLDSETGRYLRSLSVDGQWGIETLTAFDRMFGMLEIVRDNIIKAFSEFRASSIKINLDKLINKELRLLTSTPDAFKKEIDSLMVSLSGVEGMTVEALTTVKDYPVVLFSDDIPVGGVLFSKDYNGTNTIYVKRTILADPCDGECFVKKIMELSTSWGVKEVIWKIVPGIYDNTVISSLKEAGFSKLRECGNSMEYYTTIQGGL